MQKEKDIELLSKKKALEVVFAQIHKQWDKGSIMYLGQNAAVQMDAISTGSILLDNAIGIGGFPCGRIIEVFGPEASGKTTIALQTIAQAQKKGGICAFIDAEHALDPVYAEKLGINIKDLIISQPDYGEQALDIVEMLVRSNAVDIIVVDSVAALVPKAELDGDMGDVHIGLQARLMSQALRKLTPVVHKSKTVLVFINQIRQNINAMAFASKEVTTGGNALKFYSSLRIDVRRIEGLKDKDGVHWGNRLSIKIAKNKMAPPFRKVEVSLKFGEGFMREVELIDVAVKNNIILQSGSWFSFEGQKLAQGKDSVVQLLKANATLAATLEKAVIQALHVKVTPVEAVTASGDQEE